MEVFLISVYAICMLFIMVFCLVQLHLAIEYKRANKTAENRSTPVESNEKSPRVTIQLPIYNEKYVVERLLDAIIKIQWPKGALEIQVLDDSTDDTTEIIRTKLTNKKFSGYHINHIHRQNRIGYKAGALEAGMKISQGEFIAIFDADFVPHKSFLLETI